MRVDHSQTSTVSDIGVCGQRVLDAVRHPILFLAARDNAVQSQRGIPHCIGASLIIFRIGQARSPRTQNMTLDSLGDFVGKVVVHRIGEILLTRVAEHVLEAIHRLFGGQCHQVAWIQHGEPGHQRERRIAELAVTFPIGEHGRISHFRARCRGGEHHANRNQPFRCRFAGFDVVIPQILIVTDAGTQRNKFRAVDYRATANGQNQADAMLLDQSYAFQRFVQSRVRRNAGQLDDFAPGSCQRSHHIVIGTVAFNRSAAIHHQNGALDTLHLLCDMARLPFAEVDLHRVMENEISHA